MLVYYKITFNLIEQQSDIINEIQKTDIFGFLLASYNY